MSDTVQFASLAADTKFKLPGSDILYKKRKCGCGGKNAIIIATNEKVKINKNQLIEIIL